MQGDLLKNNFSPCIFIMDFIWIYRKEIGDISCLKHSKNFMIGQIKLLCLFANCY